ncbi:FecR family protein [Marinifilum sp. RC60d5]|uniref:FecR family protein n=1 Tax=Marinifilum sp. RC60d5 TaxID=3458414 RepID=UPI004035DFB2
MSEKQYIAELISKYITSNLTPVEEEYLNDWLQDPFNKMQFDRIIELNNVYENLEDLDFFHSNNRMDEFSEYIKPNRQISKWMAYAAAVFLPIVLGISVFFIDDDIFTFKQGDVVAIEQFSESVTLELNNGEVYTFDYQDSVLHTSNGILEIDSTNISYLKKDEIEDSIQEYNTIIIPRGMKYSLTLSDGTKVWLNAQTKLKYPVEFIGRNRKVFLAEGEAYFDVQENKNKPFIVSVDNEEVKVLGTEFNVRAYNNENENQITLVEGEVLVNNDQNQIRMLPNQQIKIRSGESNLLLENVNAGIFVGWKDNQLMYRNASLERILLDLERYYNIKVFYQDPEKQFETYSLSLEITSDFQNVIELLEATGSVQFEIKNNVLVVKK